MTNDWRAMLLAEQPVVTADLPGALGILAAHLRAVGPMFPEDWCETLALATWSSLCAAISVENQPVTLFWIGLNPSGAGKNITSDPAFRVALAASKCVGRALAPVTGGSVEGLLKALATEDAQHGALAYYGEFAGTLRSLHHSVAGREVLCNLYDGRPVATLLSKERLVAERPRVALIATTTMQALTEEAQLGDLVNGFLNRFLWCVPDSLDVLPERWPSAEEEARVVMALATRLQALADVTRVVLDDDACAAVMAYGRALGVGTGRVRDLDLERRRPDGTPGRLIARVKRVAALLALADDEERPDGDTVHATAWDVATAIRFVNRADAYDHRARAWFMANKEGEQQALVLSHLREHPEGMTLRQLARLTSYYKADLDTALAVLAEDGRLVRLREGRKTVYRLTETGYGDD